MALGAPAFDSTTTRKGAGQAAAISTSYKSPGAQMGKFEGAFASKLFVDSQDNPAVKNGFLTFIDSDDQGGKAMAVCGDGNFVYLANGTSGISSYLVNPDGTLTFIDSDDQGGIAQNIWCDGNFIYVANQSSVLTYSVNSVGTLTFVSSTTDQITNAQDIWGDGNFIYLANELGGVLVYSVDAAGTLTVVDSDDRTGQALGIYGDGKFIYVANGNTGILVYSVDSDGILTFIDSDYQGGQYQQVWSDGTFIYIGNIGSGTLLSYSVSTSGILTLKDSDNPTSTPIGIWGDGNYIYVGGWNGGLHAYSVSSGGILTRIASNTQSTHNRFIWGDGEFIYSASDEDGLFSYSTDNAYSYNKTTGQHEYVQNTVISTNFKLVQVLAGVSIYISDGTNPNTVLSGTAGDICLNGVSGSLYKCTAATAWVDLGNVESGTATGQTLYWDNAAGEWKHAETSEIFWDDTNKSLGLGTATPDASATLELLSTTTGFLPPRMTATQRDAISSPAEGLIVYDLTNNKPDFYNGTVWRAFVSTDVATFAIGSVPFATGAHHLSDDSVNFFWDNTNKRLGIGTNSPLKTLDVNGDVMFRENINIEHNVIVTDSVGIGAVTPNAKLEIIGGEVVSTNFTKTQILNGVTFWVSDGATPQANLSGTQGDICYNGPSGQPFYCTGTTNWTGM